MSGTFLAGEEKERPGIYHRKENGAITLLAATDGVTAAIIRANWGPLNTAVEIDKTEKDSISSIFGSGNTEEVIALAFEGGAETCIAVRIGEGGTEPTITLNSAITLTGKYVGDRAFSVTIRDSITDEGKECIIYEGITQLEKFTFSNADAVQELVDAINKSSKLFTAKFIGEGAIENVTQSEFTAGTQPIANTVSYSDGLNVLESYSWNTMCVDTNDPIVHKLVANFLTRIEEAGKYPMAVVAEDNTDVDFDTRIANAKAFNDYKMCYVLNDAVDGDDVVNGYRLAAYTAGLISGTKSTQSITHQVVDFTDLKEVLTDAQIRKALKSGCIVFTKNLKGQVWVEKGINTLVNPSGDLDEGWKKIKRVRVRHELMERIDINTEDIIGKVNNDAAGRSVFITKAQAVIDEMIAEGKLTSGTIVEDDSNTPKGDSAWFIISVDDPDSLEIIYLTYKFRFTAE